MIKLHKITRVGKIDLRLLMLVSLPLLMGKACEVDVTDQKVADTVSEVNTVFRQGYQEMLTEIGTRRYDIDRHTAFTAMKQTLENLGFMNISSEADYYINGYAPAPLPLDGKDWQRAMVKDEPVFKTIAVKHLGFKGNFATFEPEGLEIHGIITIIDNDTKGGVDISITMRMVEVKLHPPESILPRRDYPPPAAARIGFEKVWNLFEKQALPVARMAGKS